MLCQRQGRAGNTGREVFVKKSILFAAMAALVLLPMAVQGSQRVLVNEEFTGTW